MKKKIIVFGIGFISLVLICSFIWLLCFYVPEIKKEREVKRLVKEYYDKKLEMYEIENQKYDKYEVDIAFLGDSLTDGYDLNKYYPNYVVSNRGIGGDTTFGLENRLQVSAYDLKPKVIVMLIGGNNLKTMFDNYENILIGLKENLPNTKVILISLTAMGDRWAHKNEIACLNNVKIELLANKYGYEYVDVFSHLFDITTNEIFKEYTSDGVHFNDKGYEVVTSVITPTIEKILN